MPKLNSCKFARIRTRPTFRDVTTGFPQNAGCRTSAEIPYRWRVTTHIWVVFLIGLSKFLPHTTNQKELFLGRYFAGKPLAASRNVGCFLRLKLCSHLIKLKAIRGFFADWQVQQSHQQRKRREEIGWKQGKKEKLKKWKVCILTFYIGHFKGKNMTD